MKKMILTVLLISAAGCSHSSTGTSPLPVQSPKNRSPFTSSKTPPTTPASSAALMDMHDKIESQRQAIDQEKIALDAAIQKRDTQVHFGKDLMDTVAYGISSGALTYDFVKKTGSVEKVKAFFTARNGTPAASTALVPVAEAGKDAGWLAKARTTAFRATELASAAVLGAFFIGNVYQTGSDVVVWFDSTEQIRDQRARLAQAENSLEVAEQNVDTAIQSNTEESSQH